MGSQKEGKSVADKTHPSVLAAGALTWREGSTGLEVLLVHQDRYGEWSIPKGKLDSGETFPEAAIREVEEETGYRVRLHRPLPCAVYKVPDGRSKLVHYWLATVRAQTAPGPADADEIDHVQWVSLKDARSLLTRPNDVVAMQTMQFYIDEGTMRTEAIVIQRHAAARSRAKWSKSEKSRPLSSKGKKQAIALTGMLGAYNPEYVVSSGWKRCVDSVRPFARVDGLRIHEKTALTESGHDKNPARTRAIIERLVNEARPGVVCTHRPVLPTVLTALSAAAHRSVKRELPAEDPYLAAGEALIAHTTEAGVVVAIERHRPREL